MSNINIATREYEVYKTPMIITEQKALEDFCRSLRGKPFLTIDTEFLRDRTYYPQLCLIQMAAPGVDAAAVDPLARGLDLKPVLELMADETIMKVFHAARQDLEIFYNLSGKLPHPLFDTQVAAMVCGYGDQIGYHGLVDQICNQRLDKGAQFTDWGRRPLSQRQIDYALDDVTYLRDVYLHLADELEREGRQRWVEQEMDILTDPATYQNPHERAWERIKIKTTKPRVLAVLRELAAWREAEAQRRDVPRNRVVRDEVLADMAIHEPRSESDLTKIRSISSDVARGKMGQAMLTAIKRGLDMPKEQCPQIERYERFPSELTPVLEMLKMLLRICCAEHGVATKLVASGGDLEALAVSDEADIPALKGWRYEVFGRAALELKRGRISLSLHNNQIRKSVLAG